MKSWLLEENQYICVMEMIKYINSKRDTPITNLNELSDEEYKMYSLQRAKDKLQAKPKREKVIRPVAIKKVKYKSQLPSNYRSYIARANRKGLEFSLSLEQFQTLSSSNCNYCGDPATGIDRVDSSKGYIKGNMVPCCKLCNIMKFNYSYETFITHIRKILNHIQ